jgi:hypothetical protein
MANLNPNETAVREHGSQGAMPITQDQAVAIIEFMAAAAKLRAMEVIRSDRFLGDIGEFLAASEFELQLAKSPRQEGHDTEGEADRVQIKFHNSPTRTNINLGKPTKYDRVLIVVGPDSLLHPAGSYAGKYCFYEFNAKHVQLNFSTKKAYSCGKKALLDPIRALTLHSTGPAGKSTQADKLKS